jgi:hypothetical protein
MRGISVGINGTVMSKQIKKAHESDKKTVVVISDSGNDNIMQIREKRTIVSNRIGAELCDYPRLSDCVGVLIQIWFVLYR